MVWLTNIQGQVPNGKEILDAIKNKSHPPPLTTTPSQQQQQQQHPLPLTTTSSQQQQQQPHEESFTGPPGKFEPIGMYLFTYSQYFRY